jgi:hypothetical protein
MKRKPQKIVSNNSFTEFLLYTTPNGKVKVEIFLRNETVWLTQKLIALLFDCSVDNVSLHLKNIFENKELSENTVTEEFSITASDGKKYKTKHYNLDAIISVGYRVNSTKATQFRIWATERLREYIIKGFTMDDERLKNPNGFFGQDYFEEQLSRIRNIRSSERRMYQKVTDIYSECSADYNPNEEITKLFFATVQNKLHFAITGQTAAEIIYTRVSNKKENIGLTSWKNSPKGAIRETDVVIAKNYLQEEELDLLNRIVTMYLDYAEMQAKRGILMKMKDWVEKLNSFLKFNEEQILHDNGKISHEVAEALALGEYEKYRIEQDRNYVSDFDREVKKLLENRTTKKSSVVNKKVTAQKKKN